MACRLLPSPSGEKRSTSSTMRSWVRLLPAMALLPALAAAAVVATTSTTTTSTVPLCPGGDADCDDGDACTLDTCTGAADCRHDPVGVDAVRDAIDRARAVDACTGAPLPSVVSALVARAPQLLDRAAADSNQARASRFVRAAFVGLKPGLRRAAAA